MDKIAASYRDFVCISTNECYKLSQPGFHKYLKRKLKNLKQETELRILHELQKHKNEVTYTRVIPTLMKSLRQTENLVSYLSNENMQQILITGQSQAALNEQCEFGYNACSTKIGRYASAIFRFAVNRSMSRETEKNELWDYELEALLATGHIEQALALAQNVYLSEERLKSFLIIARRKKLLSSYDYDIVKDNIDQLVSIIEFEKIPDKAIELAKLLLPIDYKAAICIVDRVTRANKETINADKVYSMMSLLANNKTDNEMGNVTNFDVVSSKIENDELRSFTHAAKSLFADASVDQFLTELNKLPNNSRKLHLLQFWLPEHKEKEGIGKVILEAIQLIVAVSGTNMPKARILNRVCQSMAKMNEDEMMKAMAYIESMSETIKYPTFDYVDAELTIIEATKGVLSQKSKEHLENIYLHILDLTDDSVKVACLSKLLGRFDYLGEKAETEKTLGCSSVDIRKEITDIINKLLQKTAYHLKVVEEPIKALVCDYSTMIDELVVGINTDERKKRAYSLAATNYLLKQDEEKVSPTYFFELISKTDNTYDNREYPLELLSGMLLYADKVNHAAFLPVVKKEFHFFEELERASQKVMIFMRLYLWVMKNFPTDRFAVKLKDSVLKNWDLIDTLKAQIECGFFLAKNFAKTSKEDAEAILNKCNALKAECLLGSSSCVSAYEVAMKLYVRSMSLLVRYGLSCDESMLSQFRDDIDSQLSSVEKTSIWGNIALEYYLANNHQQFDKLCIEYIPTDLNKLSVMSQKCIIYRVAPALFIHSRDAFYTLLDKYDETFKNDCLRCIAEFIIGKQSFLSGTSLEQRAYDLDYKDYQDLIAILEHSTADDTYYQLSTIISKSLREGKPKHTLSLEQKRTIINRLEQVVGDNLPTAKGIQHDGYKIACLATLKHVNGDFASDQKTYWETEIGGISNNADRAFLFLQIAPYFKKKQDKTEFFQKGIKLADSLASTYDKVSRLDMSINECMENNLSDMVKPVAESALTSLRINGTLEDHQRLIDMVYQHKPELAEEMVNNMDRDPARVQYKQRLLNHISSAKKLKQAHENFDKDDFSRIHRLSLEEQIKFFEKRLDDIVNGTGQLLDVETIFKVCIKHIFANNIENTQWAILYIMEDIFSKYKLSKENQELLFSIHSALRFNLKLALSLGAGTKERINRVDSLIHNHTNSADGYIQVGEEEKAMAYITNWYQSVRYNTLTIIDPYFKPKDLDIIKTLCDINNDLEIRILTHRGKYCNEDYSSQWKTISSGVTNNIRLNFVSYTDKPDSGPMHDRYWICSDEDNDTHEAIMLCSVDSLGKKESSITKADNHIALTALTSYMRYAYTQIKTIKGQNLQYDSMNLD